MAVAAHHFWEIATRLDWICRPTQMRLSAVDAVCGLDANLAVCDHNVPTTDRKNGIADPVSRMTR
jgi:hypothetical protein